MSSCNVRLRKQEFLASILIHSKVVQAGWAILVVASSAGALYLEYRFDLMKDITNVWSAGTAVMLGGTIVPLLLATIDLRVRGRSWGDVGLRRPDRLLHALFLIPVIVLLALIADVALTLVMERLADAAPVNVSHLDNIEGNLPGFVWGMIVMWTTAAFAEEMLFRGYLMSRIAELIGPRAAGWAVGLLVSAFLFGISHAYQGPAGIIGTGTTGLVFGVGYLLSRRNLWPVIIVHGIANSIGFVALYLGAPL